MKESHGDFLRSLAEPERGPAMRSRPAVFQYLLPSAVLLTAVIAGVILCAAAFVPASAVAAVADSFEPDGSAGTAKPLTVGAAAQQRTIFPADDEDWVSFSVDAGWRYTIETTPGTPADDPDTRLYLYDSDGTTQIGYNDDDTGYYSRIDYEPDANGTVYVRVIGWSTGTYALSVTKTPAIKLGVVPASIDFGNVSVGDSLQQTVVVQNQGAAPLDVGSVQIVGAGYSIVRDEAGGTSIPVGGSREIEVAFAPTVGYAGAPQAVWHRWTNVVVQYNYSGGSLISYFLYSGFQNTGGAGDLGWRVKTPYLDRTGAGAVVPGGRYTVKMVLYPGNGSGLVELLEPVSDSFSFGSLTLGSGLGNVTYIRVADASLSIASNDDDDPTTYVDLFGVALPAAAIDTTAPTTTANGHDGLWHKSPVTVTLAAVDNAGGSGMTGGAAKTEYQVDAAATWTTGTSVPIGAPTDHSNDGVHVISFRSVDAAGNVEAVKIVSVKIDTLGPVTATRSTSGRKGRAIVLRYKVSDALSPKATAIRIVVKNSHGIAVKTFRPTAKNTATWYSVKWTPKARGTYRYYVYAKDLAGNAQSKVGSARVVVR